MVQIPQYTQQVGFEAPARDVPGFVAPNGGGIGQALQSLGGAITDVAQAAQARQQRKAAFNAKIGFDTYQEKLGQALEVSSREAPVDGSGLHDNFMLSTRAKEATAFLSTITDPDLRDHYKTILDTADAEHWSNVAANTEWKMSNKHTLDQLDGSWTKAGQGIASNPGSVDAYVKDMIQSVDEAPDLTAQQRDDLKQKIRENGPKLAAEALKTMDPEALQYVHTRADNDTSRPGLPTESQRFDFLTRRLAPNLPGVPPEKVKAAIEKNGGDVGAALGQLADEAGIKEADKPAFVERGLSSMGPARLLSGKGGHFKTSAANIGSAAGLIAHYEGFRTKAYWDVNHYRVGFGSDTVTLADGTVQKVGKNTVITRADAERDLQRRIAETQKNIAADVGSSWAGLSEGAKAALTSVAYNYGSLPSSVMQAARSGDAGAISQAIAGLSGHNGGVNAKRRSEEAAIASGGAVPQKRVQLADASGTGGLPMSDAGPADGVPGGPDVSPDGFVSPAFADLPATDLMNLQQGGSSAFAKSQQVQLAQDTADKILQMAGASSDKPADAKAAYTALDALGDAELRKDVKPLIDSHFTRWDTIQKDEQQKAYAATRTTVEDLVTKGDTAAAFNALKTSKIQPGTDQYNSLMTYISKGPVPFDEPKAELEIAALRGSPQSFAETDLQTKYGNRLTTDTIAKLMGEQQKVKATLAGQGDAAAKQQIETVTKANSLIEDNLKAIGIPTSSDKATPEDIQHANLVRAMVTKELEARQAASKTPLLLSEITDTVDSVMKTYPRFKPIESSWMPWRSADADVSMPEVLKSFDDAKADVNMAAEALRKAGKPVNAATLQQTLDDYLASQAVKNGGQ